MEGFRSSAWIWIRGLVREAEHWGDLPRRFESAIAGSKVTCLDVPGNGVHFRRSTPPSVPRIVDFLENEVRNEIPADQPAFLLSMSFGSMLSLEWLKRDPQRFAGAVLINTSVRGESPLYHRLRPRAMAELVKVGLDPRPASRENSILRLTSNHAPAYEANRAQWEAIQRRRPVSLTNAIRQLIAAAQFTLGDSPSLPPLLFLQSEKDRLVDPRCGEALHRKLGGTFRRHPWAGHDLPLDDGAWMIEQIKNWLTTINRRK